MPDSSNRGDLRLSIPAAAAFHSVARDVAVRFAQGAGAAADAAARLGEAVERLVSRVTAGQIEFTMEHRDHMVVVRASSGSISEEASCPLPD
ncbi:MAG TPA: hypothetical protein VL484_12440 [Vicinamibacterales bacterium]|jgi:ribosomal protein S12 methylthiotransferase accessory factor YcaO|nr:hypothetical protein [Vicinamibacterales bacterium]